MNAEIDHDSFIPLSLIKAHFENFVIDNGIKEEGFRICNDQMHDIVSSKKFLMPYYFENKVLNSIDILITPDAPNGSIFEDFVLGYSQYIPQDRLWEKISDHLKKRNLTVFHHLWHGMGGFYEHVLSRHKDSLEHFLMNGFRDKEFLYLI